MTSRPPPSDLFRDHTDLNTLICSPFPIPLSCAYSPAPVPRCPHTYGWKLLGGWQLGPPGLQTVCRWSLTESRGLALSGSTGGFKLRSFCPPRQSCLHIPASFLLGEPTRQWYGDSTGLHAQQVGQSRTHRYWNTCPPMTPSASWSLSFALCKAQLSSCLPHRPS